MGCRWTKAAVVVALIAGTASANERHFTYIYEPATLPAGIIELEPQTTFKYGHERFFSEIGHRLEFEVGITDSLQSALYINFAGVSEEGADGKVSEPAFGYDGLSWEWKWKLMDPVADAVGLGLYLELGAHPNELSTELKLLLDKRFGNFNFAFNAIVEPAFVRETDKAELKELEFEADIGLGYFITDAFSVGIEIRNHNEMAKDEGKDLEFEKSALFAGPVITYAADRWWTALTVMPQIAALKGATSGSILDLEDHEKLETRLILGMHL